MSEININGFKLSFCTEGEGIPTLIIGSHLYDSRVFSESLRKHLQLTFTDHRGFVVPPQENLPDEDFKLETLLTDIETIRQQLGLESFYIAGHSGHAFLALEYAKKYSEYIKGVIMTATGPSNSATRRKASEHYFETTASPDRKALFENNMSRLPELISADPDKRFLNFMLASGPQAWFDYQFDASRFWEGIYTNMQMIDYVWGKVFRDLDITKGLENFDRPVFLALGKYDFLTGPPELWNDFKPAFKDITVRIFEKSAHNPHYEEAETFNAELLKWLAGNEG